MLRRDGYRSDAEGRERVSSEMRAAQKSRREIRFYRGNWWRRALATARREAKAPTGQSGGE